MLTLRIPKLKLYGQKNMAINKWKIDDLDAKKSKIKMKYNLEITVKYVIKNKSFQVGDIVLMTNCPQNNPLKYGWVPDFKVYEVLSYDWYKIEKGNRTLIRNAKNFRSQNKISVKKCCTGYLI